MSNPLHHFGKNAVFFEIAPFSQHTALRNVREVLKAEQCKAAAYIIELPCGSNCDAKKVHTH